MSEKLGGFYPTGGSRDVCQKEGSVPALKVGSGLGIPSVPAVGPVEAAPEQTPDEQTSLLSISSAEDSRAKTYQLQASGRDLLATVRDYGTSSIVSLVRSLPSGFSSRTSLACYPATEEQILPSSFQGWRSSGMGGPTGFLTLNTSEWPNDADVCSLSDILETPGPHLERYTLSKRACQGILRRAEKRGRELPKALYHALSAVSEVATTPEPTKEPPS